MQPLVNLLWRLRSRNRCRNHEPVSDERSRARERTALETSPALCFAELKLYLAGANESQVVVVTAITPVLTIRLTLAVGCIALFGGALTPWSSAFPLA